MAKEVTGKVKQLELDDGLAAVRFGREGECDVVGSGSWTSGLPTGGTIYQDRILL